jgi:hypothetical protein
LVPSKISITDIDLLISCFKVKSCIVHNFSCDALNELIFISVDGQ